MRKKIALALPILALTAGVATARFGDRPLPRELRGEGAGTRSALRLDASGVGQPAVPEGVGAPLPEPRRHRARMAVSALPRSSLADPVPAAAPPLGLFGIPAGVVAMRVFTQQSNLGEGLGEPAALRPAGHRRAQPLTEAGRQSFTAPAAGAVDVAQVAGGGKGRQDDRADGSPRSRTRKRRHSRRPPPVAAPGPGEGRCISAPSGRDETPVGRGV